MSWVSVAVAVGGQLIGGAMGAGAASDAADAQSQASQSAIAEQRREYDRSRSDNAPYRAAGVSAIGRLAQLLGIGGTPGGRPSIPGGSVESRPILQRYATQYGNGDFNAVSPELRNQAYSEEESSTGADSSAADYGSLNKKFSIADFWNDPVVAASYQSGLDLGTKALKNAAPLTTGLDSGAALKELTKFGTDYTGNMAGGSQQRYIGDQNNDYSRLMGIITGAGMPAVGQTTSAGMNTGNNISNLISAQGNATGAAKIAGANSWGNGISSISNWWNQNQMMNKMQGMNLNNQWGANNVFGGSGRGTVPNSYNPDIP